MNDNFYEWEPFIKKLKVGYLNFRAEFVMCYDRTGGWGNKMSLRQAAIHLVRSFRHAVNLIK